MCAAGREGAGRTVCLEFKVNQRMLSGLVDNLELSHSIKIDFNGAKSQSTEGREIEGDKVNLQVLFIILICVITIKVVYLLILI